MLFRLFCLFLGGLLLVRCADYPANTTVQELNKPPSRTIETKLYAEQIGAEAGERINLYMQQLARSIDTVANGIRMQQYPEGLRLTIPSYLWFDKDSHTLKESVDCNSLMQTLGNFEQTNYLLEVHTDGDGTRYYNQGLSERRASRIRQYLEKNQFPLSRLDMKAYGEDQPIADNSYNLGKEKNQRIEIAVFASPELKQKAQQGPLN